jgi:hypothetical protein
MDSKELESKLLNLEYLFKNNEIEYDKPIEYYQNQTSRVYKALFNEPMSMLECALLTNVMRSNICYYIENLRKKNAVFEVGKRRCKITNRLVFIHSTNPIHKSKSTFKQLELQFD